MMTEMVRKAMCLHSHLLESVDIVHCMLMHDMARSLVRHLVARAGRACSDVFEGCDASIKDHSGWCSCFEALDGRFVPACLATKALAHGSQLPC